MLNSYLRLCPFLVSLLLLGVAKEVDAQGPSSSSPSFHSDQEPPSEVDAFEKQRSEALRLVEKGLLAKEISSEEATHLQASLQPADPHRTRLWIPQAATSKKPNNASKRSPWAEATLKEVSQAAFDQAEQAIAKRQGQACLHWLLTTLALAPDHPKANSLLEPMLKAASERKFVAKASQPIPELHWNEGTYSTVETPHFQILNHASAKVSGELADMCEQTYCAWQQLFFDYWTTEEEFFERLQSPIEAKRTKKKFRVVLFRNRQEFRQQLQAVHPPENSTGYYDPGLKTAFFYWDEKEELTTRWTVRHELIHQFFSEGGKAPSRLDTFHQAGMWVVEGIALYFESMTKRLDARIALFEFGGWDSPRLQSARFRRMHDEYWVPWEALHFQTGSQWRDDPEVATLYSQSAGLAHFFLHHSPEARQQFMQYLSQVYAGQPEPRTITLTQNEETLRRAYEQFLKPSNEAIQQRNPAPERMDIVLPRLNIDSSTFAAWTSSQRKLKWFDLSFTQVDDRLFEPAQAPWVIERLSLEGSKVTNACMAPIAKLETLTELDLSLCPIDDDGLKLLEGNKRLKYLWLTGTAITDQSLKTLGSLRNLEMLEISDTKLTPDGIKSLKKMLPKWKEK